MLPNFVLVAVYLGALLLLAKPLGLFMYRVFNGERTFLSPVLGPVERGLYRLAGVDATKEMRWTTYAISMLAFSLLSVLAVYAIQRVQHLLPLNPQALAAVTADSAFNTAISFTTNTNWQGYYPETTMSYFTQMAALAVQNFVSAAVGIAIAIALIRGFVRRSAAELGNFWVDLVRATLYILLPISIVMTLVLVAGGVPQNLNPYVPIETINSTTHLLAMGPTASQEAIKELGTNGGGVFNANSAHPFENPNAFTNLVEMLMIFAIPAALTYTFGRMVGNQRQGWAIFGAMALLFLVGVLVATLAEQSCNPLLTAAGASP